MGQCPLHSIAISMSILIMIVAVVSQTNVQYKILINVSEKEFNDMDYPHRYGCYCDSGDDGE